MKKKNLSFFLMTVCILCCYMLVGRVLGQAYEILPINIDKPKAQIARKEGNLRLWNEDGKQVVINLDSFNVTEEFVLGKKTKLDTITSQFYLEESKRYYVVTNQHWEIWVYDSTLDVTGTKKKLESFYPGQGVLMDDPLVIDEKNQRGYVTNTEKYVTVFDLHTKDIINGAVASNSNFTALNQEEGIVAISQGSVTFSYVKLYEANSFDPIGQIKVNEPYISLGAHQSDVFRNGMLSVAGLQNRYVLREDGDVLFQKPSNVCELFTFEADATSDGKNLYYCYDYNYPGEDTGRIDVFESSEQRLYSILPIPVGQVGTSSWTPRTILEYKDYIYLVMDGRIARVRKQTARPPTRSLVFPYILQDEKGKGFWTGLAVSKENAGGQVTAKALTLSGNLVPEGTDLVNPVDWDFEGKVQSAKFPWEIFGDGLASPDVAYSKDGVMAIEVEFPGNDNPSGFVLQGDVDFSLFMDGYVAIDPAKAGKVMYCPVGDGIVVTTTDNQEVVFKRYEIPEGQMRSWGAVQVPKRLSRVVDLDFQSFPGGGHYYSRIESKSPIIGFGIAGKLRDESYFPGQYAEDIRKELVFAHNASTDIGETDLFIINPSDQLQTVDLYLYREDGSLEKQIARNILPFGMLWEDTAKLFFIPQGEKQNGYIKAVGRGEGLLGWIRFRIGGVAEAALTAQKPVTEATFNHVAQVKPTEKTVGMNDGLTVLNVGTSVNEVELTAKLADGTITATKVVNLAPGQKLARHLNEAEFFGKGFAQAGGKLELKSLNGQPFVTFKLFYQTSFVPRLPLTMTAIPGQ